MNCKDCIHYDVCNFVNRSYGVPFATLTEHCGDFKEKSKFIELPCKIGDTVWKIGRNEVEPFDISLIEIHNNNEIGLIDYDDNYIKDINEHIGKTVFFTREEAEKALKERVNNGNG